jgi:hypothetical protein
MMNSLNKPNILGSLFDAEGRNQAATAAEERRDSIVTEQAIASLKSEQLRSLTYKIVAKKIQKHYRDYLSNTHDNCAICLQFIPLDGELCLESNDETKLKKMPKKLCHKFHKHCIQEWIARDKKTCPICRAIIVDVDDDSLKLKMDLLRTINQDHIISLLTMIYKKKHEASSLRVQILHKHLARVLQHNLRGLNPEAQSQYIYERSMEFINGPIQDNITPLNRLVSMYDPDLVSKYNLILDAEEACSTILEAHVNIANITIDELRASMDFLQTGLQDRLAFWEFHRD